MTPGRSEMDRAREQIADDLDIAEEHVSVVCIEDGAREILVGVFIAGIAITATASRVRGGVALPPAMVRAVRAAKGEGG